MKILIGALRLSATLNERSRDRCPDVVFTHKDDEIAAIRTDCEQPTLPCAPGSFDRIELQHDALSRTIDEDAWLRELARVLMPGGELAFTVPAAGAIAWLDAMNVYRYVTDISGRGDAPNAAFPTGWNRHYSAEYLLTMLGDAGFADMQLQPQNNALAEAGMIATLLRDNWLGGDRSAERRAFPQFGARSPESGGGLLRTTWLVTATRQS